VEEARQHSALKSLFWLSTLLLAVSGALFLVGLVAGLPISGDAFVILMLGALVSRAAFYVTLYFSGRSAGAPVRTYSAFQSVVWIAIALAFFAFVVLHQFRNQL
jgi:hypothetical protein